MGTNFLGEICWGPVFTWGLMIRSCQGQGSFENTFFSTLKIVNLKIFVNHKGIHSSR